MIKKIDDIVMLFREDTGTVAVWMIKKIDDIFLNITFAFFCVAVWMIKKIDDIPKFTLTVKG